MVSSINTNTAALYAQANITTATNASAESVARLSSGNRIVEASDDVTALAIGTSLGTQVSALKTAQTNASQGSSLLQVADGALAQIQSILQQQQSVAQQAESGSLTDTDRGFLNQEFQALSNEINALASGTTFNGVNLIDGSIAAAGTVGSTNPLVSTSADTTGSVALATIGSATVAGTQTANILLGQGVGFYSFTGTGSAANEFSAAALTGPSNGNASGNDATLTQPALAAATATATANGTIDPTGQGVGTPTGTAYTVNVTIGGVAYSGTLAMAATGDPLNGAGSAATTYDGSVAGGTQLVLTATSGANTHGTITLTVDAAGFTGASHADGDLSTTIASAVQAQVRLGSVATGAIGAVTIVAPTASGSPLDTALQGDLSQGTFNVFASSAVGVAGTVGASGSATGYTVQYSINGVTYQGLLATTGTGVGTTGTTSVVLAATNDPSSHSAITVAIGTAFGVGDATADQSGNITDALNTKFDNASLVSSVASATISGTTSTDGITGIAASNNLGKNDTSLVGDLSAGTFNVTGSNAAGFSVSYTLNGSTYSGSLSAYKATSGGNLFLTNGTGTINFTIGAAASATASTAAAFQAALGTFLTSTTNGVTTGATALAVHSVATVLAKDTSGAAIPNSGITTASNVGTVIAGFNGANVTLTSASYDAGDTQIPPLATFSATGTGTSTVFSVIIDGVTYSTGSLAAGGVNNNDGTSDDGVLAHTEFEGNAAAAADNSASAALGSAGVLTFFKNGDDTSHDQLVLNMSGVSTAAKINTTGDVQNVVDALNSAFGSGGSTGGLDFQLGTTTTSNVTVNIGSAKTTALFGSTALDISTQAGAGTAATAVTAALNTVTSLRSGVGALETQFNFASSALQSSVQNEGAAESDLLDTDIASESTNFATEQVKLQAGISVLAQANQQLQALLKLIG